MREEPRRCDVPPGTIPVASPDGAPGVARVLPVADHLASLALAAVTALDALYLASLAAASDASARSAAVRAWRDARAAVRAGLTAVSL